MSAGVPTKPPRWERPLLGDWNRVVRDPIDVLRFVYLFGGIAFVAAGQFGKVPSIAFGGAVALLARFISLPRPFDLGIVLGMLLPTAGNTLGLFKTANYYDNVTHLFLSAFAAPVFYLALARLEVMPDLRDTHLARHRVGVFLSTLAFGMAFGAGYEIYEWVVTHWLGATLQTGYTDTVDDLFLDAVGSAIGATGLVVWSLYGWATTRRVSGSAIG